MAVVIPPRQQERREVLSLEEVADLLGVGVSLVRENIASIPHKRLGRRLLFGRQAVLAWVNDPDDAMEEKEVDHDEI